MNLPKTESEAYEQTIARIQRNGADTADTALHTLGWIFHARRPLKMGELREALLVGDGVPIDEISEDDCSASDIVFFCEGFVVHEQSSDIIRFTHTTVSEWLPKSEAYKTLPQPVYFAKTCLTYLEFTEFNNLCFDKGSLMKRINKYNFIGYASQYWGEHTRDVESMVQDEVSKTFRFHRKRESMYQVKSYLEWPWDGIILPGMGLSLLHIIAENGLIMICDAFISGGFILDDLYISSLSGADGKILRFRWACAIYKGEDEGARSNSFAFGG